jgi:SprT protein
MNNNIQKYIPSEAHLIITNWIETHKVELKITRKRTTRLGDYRHPFKDKGHRISINNNLNQYAFLITLVHEFAHLFTWNQYKNKVKPHGVEWKYNYQLLMKPFFDIGLFPSDIQNILYNHMKNPTASSCSNIGLQQILALYNTEVSNKVYLSSLPIGSSFVIDNGRIFKKTNIIRKRIRCEEVASKRMYSFSQLHPVEQVI